MFEAFVGVKAEIADLKKNNALWKNKAESYQSALESSKQELDYLQRTRDLDIEEALSGLRKEMQKDLVMADVKLAGARGKLEAYEKLAITKDEMMKLFSESFGTISSKPDIKVLKAE